MQVVQLLDSLYRPLQERVSMARREEQELKAAQVDEDHEKDSSRTVAMPEHSKSALLGPSCLAMLKQLTIQDAGCSKFD